VIVLVTRLPSIVYVNVAWSSLPGGCVNSSVAVPASGCGLMCSIRIFARSPKRSRQTLIESAAVTVQRMPAERPSLEKLPSMTETSSRNLHSVRRGILNRPRPVTTNP
jgi:hypothetical protein